MNPPLTRWENFYRNDPNLGMVAPSVTSRQAADIFAQHNKRCLLDLACGTGRDTSELAVGGAQVVGADAACSGLLLANQRLPGGRQPLGYVQSAAQSLPFAEAFFDGVYCFGLLHEFIGECAHQDVAQTMCEIYRVLQPGGILILAVLAGEPMQGLPHVQLFSEKMFDDAVVLFNRVEKRLEEDVSCTGVAGYKVWYGIFTKA